MANPPLLSLPEAPAPRNGGAEWLEAKDGERLRVALFLPDGPARGSVVLSPGRAEFIEKYFEVIGELQERGFAVLTHDWRGQGLSDRSKRSWLWGHARGWRPFISDFRHLLDCFEDRLPKPWIAVGHSMGGGLTALALAEGEERFAAVVLSAPMLSLETGTRSTASVRRLALMMNFAGRSRQLVLPPPDPRTETFESNVVTHDRARWERAHAQMLADPGLKEGGVTWGWLAFALILSERVFASRRIDRLDIPVAIVAAEEEKLVANGAAKAMAARAPHGRYVEVPGAYHEILMETDPRRAAFWTEFDAVADQIAPAASVQPRRTA